MHLLVVEDEEKIRRFLCQALAAEGHTVQPLASYEEAEEWLTHALDTPPDAALLDRLLQGKDGAKLIPLIRGRYPDCAIVVVSAISTAEEKSSVLDMGADDYLSKPFSLIELSARLRVQSRKKSFAPAGTSRVVSFGNCQMDLLLHQVLIDGKKVELSSREYQLLSLLLQNPGRVYNRFHLLDQIWNTQFDIESNVVEVTMNHLRKKLSKAGSDLKILSKRNVGYWLEA